MAQGSRYKAQGKEIKPGKKIPDPPSKKIKNLVELDNSSR
jgi:hypothetical protein